MGSKHERSVILQRLHQPDGAKPTLLYLSQEQGTTIWLCNGASVQLSWQMRAINNYQAAKQARSPFSHRSFGYKCETCSLESPKYCLVFDHGASFYIRKIGSCPTLLPKDRLLKTLSPLKHLVLPSLSQDIFSLSISKCLTPGSHGTSPQMATQKTAATLEKRRH